MAKAVARPGLSVGSVLGRSLRIWARNIVPFTAAGAFVFLPVLAGIALLPEPRSTCAGGVDILLGIIALFAPPLLWMAMPAAVIHGVLQELRGERASILGCLRVHVTRFLPVLGAVCLIGLAGIPLMAVFGFAVMLFDRAGAALGEAMNVGVFSVLGALVSCLFWVAIPVAAVERPGVRASLGRSLRLTRGARGAVFVISIVTIGLPIAALAALERLMDAHKGPFGEWVPALVVIVLSGYGAVACAVGYHDLRAARDGTRVEDLVRVFQ